MLNIEHNKMGMLILSQNVQFNREGKMVDKLGKIYLLIMLGTSTWPVDWLFYHPQPFLFFSALLWIQGQGNGEGS